jgi:tetratricopeptide (TPR) repeat protein
VYTDLSPPEARSQLDQFETLRDALEQVAFPPSGEPEGRVTVVLFRRHHDYEALGAPGTNGVFYPRLPLDIEREPAMLVSGGLTGQTRRTFVHELVHELMHRAFGDTPPWLNEGLADYFSSISIEAGQIVLGAPVPERVTVPRYLLPTVSDITHADQDRFLKDDSGSTAARYYTGAWLLVHLLRNGPERYRDRFDRFARALNDGKSADVAWRESMAGLDEETLQRDFEAHVESSEWPRFGKNAATRSSSSSMARPMRPAEVHLLWARIAPHTQEGRSFAADQIGKAAALEPETAEIEYARGCLAMALESYGDASVAFRKSVTLSPHEPRYLFGLALSLSAEPFGTSGHAQEISRTGDALVAAATSPEQEALGAYFLMAANHPDEALQRAEHAVRGDGRCVQCAVILAKIRAARGDITGAIAALERVLSASLDSPQDQALLAELEKYRRESRGEGEAWRR